MSITRDNPYSEAFDFYGDPDKLVEFRLFSLNKCAMDCKGCFFNRLENDFDDFESALLLARDLAANQYTLETCYLNPTDIFDNKDNYKLFDNRDLVETIGMFNYLGIATTLEDGYDEEFFEHAYSINDRLGVDIQVNLYLKKLFDVQYQTSLKNRIHEVKQRYGDRVVLNLAINTGFDITEKEEAKIKKMVYDLSEDGIVELGFTFLYNKDIPFDKKRTMLQKSIGTINSIGDYYQEHSSFVKRYNDRTFLTKPSFAFIGSPNRIYCKPIIPFDEYVFVETEDFRLKEPSYNAFLDCYGNAMDINTPILEKCGDCENLQFCLGKGYFSVANAFNFGCFLDEGKTRSTDH